MDNDIISLLKETRRVIAEEGWVQGRYYGEHGGGCCLMGVAFDRAGETVMHVKFPRALGFENDALATAWNDDPARTKEEVLARLDAAIRGAV